MADAVTTETAHPSVTPSSIKALLGMAENVLETVDHFVPNIRMVEGVIPYGGAIVQGVTFLNPLLERVIMFAMAETGKSFGEILKDVISHIVPGLPNLSVLGPGVTGVAANPANPVGE